MRPHVEHLPGNVGGATRVGDTVVRPAGPWTPAVHSLLDHLAAAGLPGVPRVIGTDDGTETLTFLPGRSIEPDAELPSEPQLTAAVRWLRGFHDAARSFRPTEPLRWRGHPHPVTLAPDEIVCHHDPGTYNWVVDGDTFVGMIDWDMAGPGRPVDDLAFLCWTGLPLVRSAPADEVARRLRLVAAAYDGPDPRAILDAADLRMRSAARRIADGQRRGDPGLVRLGEIGEPRSTLDALDAFARRRPAIEAALDAVGGAE